ncbi:MAG: lipoate-protein ligase [Dehalococcoidia bacterium]|nr:lipoate-protein ligase [Dehalococcoidia bacterium]
MQGSPCRSGSPLRSSASSEEACRFARLGVTDYLEAWGLQKAIARQRGEGSLPDTLILLEHPHTYTQGRRGKGSDVLLGEEALERLGVRVCQVDRGGEVTYHGPGQMVGYPIVDIRPLGGAVGYVRTLEVVLMDTLRDFGLEAQRHEGLVGVWVGREKIAAIGVRVSRGVSTHGFALNVNPDLSYFQHIVPCGIRDRGVTSMERLLGRPVPLEQVALRLVHHFGLLFHRSMEEVSPGRLRGPRPGAAPCPAVSAPGSSRLPKNPFDHPPVPLPGQEGGRV